MYFYICTFAGTVFQGCLENVFRGLGKESYLLVNLLQVNSISFHQQRTAESLDRLPTSFSSPHYITLVRPLASFLLVVPVCVHFVNNFDGLNHSLVP